MKKENPKVDEYLVRGCGRCSFYDTPKCKVNNWQTELKELRKILLSTDLVEEVKWSFPCYTHDKKNILILSAFKEYCSINFFKGALLKDPKKILELPGENTQSAKILKFINTKEIKKLEPIIRDYIKEAIEIEKSGKKVVFRKVSEEKIPEEFQNRLDKNAKLKTAFESLTPGKQRAYLIYFSQPKQSGTRESRIDKSIQMILAGKGLNDDYVKSKGKMK